MSAIESLKKITYENLAQFEEAINRNFAIIENSPLYKGIPGTEGGDGEQGLRGIRGIKFLFVIYANFNEQFPGELTLPSKITIDFINSKVSNFETRQKLFTALGVTEFVDKDVIVLTNSTMLSYDGVNEIFFDTGMAFNPESNLLANINQVIEDYVQYYVDNNPALNGLVNIFQVYETYAKNYADNNSTFITNELTESSVYSPYIPGFNSTIGIKIDNHKYYGYNDTQFPITNSGTFVFGSQKRYYQLLMNTISTSGTETLSSDYAPGAGNIPTAVFLQDTYRNGIYIGHKDKTNLKRFGTIYKNVDNDLVLKSDSSMIESEYAELLINRAYLRFKKLVQFYDSLEVSRDLTVFSDISNKHVRTGKFTTGANAGNQYNTNKSEFGALGAGTIKVNASEFDEYIHYLDKVLVTNSTGRVVKDYAIEKIAMNNTQLVDLNQITGYPTNSLNVLTSNYFAFLAAKVNNIQTYVAGNYWRKNQFNTGEIPDLNLSNNLTVNNNVNLANGLLIVDKNASLTEVKTVTTNIDSTTLRTKEFKNNVLVTDSGGYISKLYSLEVTAPTINYNATTGALTVDMLPNADKELLTSTYYNYLATLINSTNNFTVNNYWRKNQFGTGEIPGLRLSTSFITDGIVTLQNSHGTHFDLQKSGDGLSTNLTIGNDSTTNPTNVVFKTSKIQYNKFLGKLLITDGTGNLINQYFLATGDISVVNNNFTNGGVAYTVPFVSLPTQTDDNSAIPLWKHIKVIGNFLNTIITWTQTNFWRKDQYNTGEIPNIKVSNELKAEGNVAFGPAAAPNISTSGTTTNVGKTGFITNIFGTIKVPKYLNSILTTSSDGTIVDTYGIDTNVPTYTSPGLPPGYDPWAKDTIESNFYSKLLHPQNVNNVPTLDTKIPTSKHWNYLLQHIYVIRDLLYDRPTYAEINLSTTGFIKYSKITLTGWTKDRKYNIANPLAGTDKIMGVQLFLENVVAEGGYFPGDIATAQGPGMQDAFNKSDYDYGMGVDFRESYGMLTICIGDVIWIRRGHGDASTNNDVISITANKWKIRIIIFYIEE